jgi:hydrogenase nickel incorporation protein HypA/HybF
MHEASIAQSVIDAVERRIASGLIDGRVCGVFLRVGRLTAVVPENLTFMFGVLKAGTALEGAELAIEEVPVRGVCRACGAESEFESICFLCPGCGSPDVDLTSGRELVIDAVEVS